MILKTELIDRVWEKVNIGKVGRKERFRRVDIEKIINTMFDEMTQCMIDGVDIRLDGFGKFSSRIRQRRNGVNPKTQEPLYFQREGLLNLMFQKIQIEESEEIKSNGCIYGRLSEEG